MTRLGLEGEIVDRENHARAVAHLRAARVVLPKFSELADPATIPDGISAALADVGDYPCRIDAQTYLHEMYARHGFIRAGEEFLDDGVPHVPMLRAGTDHDEAP